MFGLVPSVGLIVDGRFGDQEYVAKDVVAGKTSDSGGFRGLNLGGYVGARYRPPDFPAFGEVRWHFGGVAGLYLALGVAF